MIFLSFGCLDNTPSNDAAVLGGHTATAGPTDKEVAYEKYVKALDAYNEAVDACNDVYIDYKNAYDKYSHQFDVYQDAVAYYEDHWRLSGKNQMLLEGNRLERLTDEKDYLEAQLDYLKSVCEDAEEDMDRAYSDYLWR